MRAQRGGAGYAFSEVREALVALAPGALAPVALAPSIDVATFHPTFAYFELIEMSCRVATFA